MEKRSLLLPEVTLQPHQARIQAKAKSKDPLRQLLYWQLGSGKSLGGIAAAEAKEQPYTATVPASLRENLKGEIAKFTDQSLPSHVMSYTAVGNKHSVGEPGTILADEVQRLRNPATAQTKEFMKATKKAPNVVLMSGTPIVNRPGDLAVPMSILTGKEISPSDFESRYVKEKKVYPSVFHRLLGVKPGIELDIAKPEELKALLKGHVDYYSPGKPVVPVDSEEIHTTMSVEQSRLYRAMFDQLPWIIKWKMRHDFPMTADEMRSARAFLTGPRQVGLSTYPYLRSKNPLKAFEQSGKLKEAHRRLMEHLEDPRKKALIFSNFISAGLTPYSAALTRSGISHGVFYGGLTDSARRRLVEDYNDGKIRVALIGPSGTEGLSFKGTQVIQQLDPHFTPVRGQQAVGRGLRFDSHTGLPEDLQNVRVEKYVSRLPMGFSDRLLSHIGLDRTNKQHAADDYLQKIERRKDRLNSRFLDLLKEVGTNP
jgi:superfamily II DNA or RNA helicase